MSMDGSMKVDSRWLADRGVEPPACDGRLHATGSDGHDGGPATHAVTCRCGCGTDEVMLLCAGRVREVLGNGLGIECRRCGAIYPNVRDYWIRVVPLAGPERPQEPARATVAPSGPLTTDGDVLRMLELDMRARACRPRSILETRITLQRLARDLGKPLADANRSDLIAFLTRPELKPYSVRTYRSALVSFYGLLAAEGVIPTNPTARLPKVRVPHSEPNPLTTAEVQRLLDCGIRRRTRMMVLLATYQGLRASEIAEVHGSAVNWTTGELTVRNGKGGTELVRPLHSAVLAEAAAFPRDGYWFPGNGQPHIGRQAISKTLAQAMRRAGILGHRPHQLRAWHATELVAAGTDTVTVQHSMRHADLSSLHKYTRPSNERIRSAIEQLPPLDASGRHA